MRNLVLALSALIIVMAMPIAAHAGGAVCGYKFEGRDASGRVYANTWGCAQQSCRSAFVGRGGQRQEIPVLQAQQILASQEARLYSLQMQANQLSMRPGDRINWRTLQNQIIQLSTHPDPQIELLGCSLSDFTQSQCDPSRNCSTPALRYIFIP